MTKLLLEVGMDEDSTYEATVLEKEDGARYICGTIKNMTLHLNKKSKQVRHSSHIMNICLALYMISKSRYEDLQ